MKSFLPLALSLLLLPGCNFQARPLSDASGPIAEGESGYTFALARAKQIKIDAPAFNDDQDILAFTLAENSKDSSPSPAPSPSTKVKIGDVCPVCNGRGKSGDGIQPCMQCGGDGRVDAGDPILNSSSSPQEKSPTLAEGFLNFVTQDEFQKWKTQDFASKTEELVGSMSDLNKALSARIAEIKAEQENLRRDLNAALDRIKALENGPTNPSSKPAAPTTSYDYRIQFQGSYWTWSSDQKAFVRSDGWKITIPNLTDPATRASVQVCVPGPNNKGQDVCTICPVEKVPHQAAINPALIPKK